MKLGGFLDSLKKHMRGEGRASLNIDALQAKYELFRRLAEANTEALEIISDLQAKASGDYIFDRVYLESAARKAMELGGETAGLLQRLSGERYAAVEKAHSKLKEEVEAALRASPPRLSGPQVLGLSEVPSHPEALSGAKVSHLAKILIGAGLPVPEGFCVTSVACFEFLDHGGLLQTATDIVEGLSIIDKAALDKASEAIQKRIRAAPWPEPIAKEIMAAFGKLEERLGQGTMVSVRSSAFGEDGAFSFAGQFGTILNVGRGGLLEACSEVVASQFSPRALVYYKSRGISEGLLPMAVGVISMVDARVSGVLYTRDPEEPASEVMAVAAQWGLGTPTVDGSKTPDLFSISGKDGTVLNARVARKEKMLLCREGVGLTEVSVPGWMQKSPSLTHHELRQLAEYGNKLDSFFQGPQDVEWALDSRGTIYVLQSRPLRLKPHEEPAVDPAELRRGLKTLLREGVIASRGCAAGEVFILKDEQQLHEVPPGAILVARSASPRIAEALDRVAGIICDAGSSASHLGTVAREFNIPALFDARSATRTLRDGAMVTLDAEMGNVYEGSVTSLLDAHSLQKPKDAGAQSPLLRRAKTIAALMAPLNLTDPQSPAFKPSRCKSLNDILRFAHEKAVEEIFLAGSRFSRAGGNARRLVSSLPLDLRIIDLGGGLAPSQKEGIVTPGEFLCRPLIPLWKGIMDVPWSLDAAASGGQVASLMMTALTDTRAAAAASSPNYVIVSGDALNFSFRLGYHFSRVDARIGGGSALNYASFLFQGGAANAAGKERRASLISKVLEGRGFRVTSKGDALFARTEGDSEMELEEKLRVVGGLLVATRQADTMLQDNLSLERALSAYANGDLAFGFGDNKEAP